MLLFVPLGVSVALVPPGLGRSGLMTFAVLLPFAIESVQLLVPVLDRACEGADIVDNLLGLLLGWAIGWTVHRVLGSRIGSGRRGTR